MNLLLVAHGTRKPGGVAMVGDLAQRVGALLDRVVQVAFVDVLGPTPTEVLAAAAVTGEPAVVVPAFLSCGYHVRTDLPAHVAASGHCDVTVTPALGPSRQLVQVIADRLIESGWRPSDSVILAAAGSSDAAARSDLHTAATLLSALIGSPVELAFAATGEPSVPEAVAAARRRSSRRVAVASYLLADGLFQYRLRRCGADVVSEPLGPHPEMSRLIASRFAGHRYQSVHDCEGREVTPSWSGRPADLNAAVGGDPGRIHRHRHGGIVEAVSVIEGERLLSDGFLHDGPAGTVSDDATGQHRRTGERVDVAQRVQRSVIEAEQCRLDPLIEQHADAAAGNQELIGTRRGPGLVIGGQHFGPVV
jgi:sirohydrochlorin ferrochelatase